MYVEELKKLKFHIHEAQHENQNHSKEDFKKMKGQKSQELRGKC